MGRKAKYTFEQKLKTVQDYLSGKKSAAEIASELDIGKMVTTECVNGRISIKLTGKKLSVLKKEIHLTQKNSKIWSFRIMCRTDCQRTNWQQNTMFTVKQSSFNGSKGIITI
ncbi:MAG: hypothetical protein PUF34_06335 [Sharpea azabuensis]|nr:hypothetical protein [Sharpea azabuensis]MDD6512826.1 hypothetical protein [Sharpea azabuensis]